MSDMEQPEQIGPRSIEVRELEVNRIKVPVHGGGDYQRDLNKALVRSIVDRFDPLLLGVLEVAFIDGTYWVWDGQHRLVALKERGIRTVHCLVAYGYTIEDLAHAFAIQGVIRRRVKPKDVFRSEIAARNPMYLAAMETIEHHGYRLNMHRAGPGWNGPGLLNCHDAIIEVLSLDGGLADLNLTMRVMKEAWLGASTQGSIFHGLAEFIHFNRNTASSPVGEKDYFARRLIEVLSTHGEKWLLTAARERGAAKLAEPMGSLRMNIRRVIRDLYNSGLRKHRLA